MALYQAYYEGQHRETYKIRRVIEAFGLRMPIYVNYAGVVVDSISERLGVDGFTFGGDDRASEAAWEIWQDNNLDAGFKRGMRAGLIKGEFSLVLWPDEDWSPRIWVEDGAEVIVSVHPETGVRRAALKRWTDEDEPGAMFATLFLPDAVYKYRTPRRRGHRPAAELATVGGTAWERRIVPGEPWPLPNPLGVVPVIPFPNKPDLHLAGESELGKVVPIQDAINANIANVMLAGLYGAFRQKVMLNFALEVDPATGAPVQPFDVALDSLITVPAERAGRARAAARRVQPDRPRGLHQGPRDARPGDRHREPLPAPLPARHAGHVPVGREPHRGRARHQRGRGRAGRRLEGPARGRDAPGVPRSRRGRRATRPRPPPATRSGPR